MELCLFRRDGGGAVFLQDLVECVDWLIEHLLVLSRTKKKS